MIKRKSAIGRTLAFLLIMVLTLSACDGSALNLLGGSTSNNVRTSQKIYLPMEKIKTLNPVASKDADTYYINKLVYDGLFDLDETLSAVPNLVSSYSYSEDGTELTLRLKDGVTWHDGETLNGEDVKFSIESYIGNGGRHLFDTNVSNIRSVSVSKNDSNEVTIDFKKVDGALLELLTFPILPSHLYKSADIKKAEKEFIPVGTGPYRVSSYNSFSELVLLGHGNYHGGFMPQNEVIFSILPTRESGLDMLDVNAISFAVSMEGDRDMIYRNPRVKVSSFASNEMVFIGFNLNQTLLSDRSVRKALAHAIDSEDILESSYYKSGIQSDCIYYPGFLGVGVMKDAYAYDIERSKELLEDAGLYDNDKDGFYETTGGGIVSLNLVVNSENMSRVAAAMLIKNTFESKLGIVCNVVSLEDTAYKNAISAGNYDIYIGGAQIKENFDLRFLLHSGYKNPARYRNDEMDIFLDQLQMGNTPEERNAIYEQIHEILLDELPYYCLLYKTYGAVSSPALRGTVSPTFFNPYRSVTDWTCVYTQTEAQQTS